MAPVVKKSAHGSNSTRSVMVTLIGDGGSPRAVRASRRSLERTSSRGLSVRTVFAPTRIASQEARTASTRSKSARLDNSSRRGAALPR